VLTLIVALVAVVATAVTAFPGGGHQSDLAPREFDTTGPETAIPVPDVTDQQLAGLPEATTFTTFGASAPVDDAEEVDDTVIHNDTVVPVFTAPGGTAFARLPATQIASPTWLPVVAELPGWVAVLLPSRPNGVTGWLSTSRLTFARTGYRIRIHHTAMTLELFHDGRSVGTWPVSIGRAEAPTPLGRTFLLASLHDPAQTFSATILPLGAHSTTMDSFGGGPGTVAIHTWPDDSVIGTATSHGCVRVPAEAMRALDQVPLGSIVTITNT